MIFSRFFKNLHILKIFLVTPVRRYTPKNMGFSFGLRVWTQTQTQTQRHKKSKKNKSKKKNQAQTQKRKNVWVLRIIYLY
jgi:hypothetical protein